MKPVTDDVTRTRSGHLRAPHYFLCGALLTAATIRLVLWAWVAPYGGAADEPSYLYAIRLLWGQGQQYLFWPPVTGWLGTGIAILTGGVRAMTLRLAWVVLDICNVALLWRWATHVFSDSPRADRIALISAAMYAVHLPAIAFSQFVTSETPMMFLLLSALNLLTPLDRHLWFRVSLSGMILGLVVLTRTSLLPLPIALAGVIYIFFQDTRRKKAALALMAMAALPVLAFMVRNEVREGRLMLTNNAEYNLYLGNQENSQSELNLFSPAATRAQIDYRRRSHSTSEETKGMSPSEMRSRAIAFIRAHPVVTLRRVLGRFARVFAPKTAHLSLIGDGTPVTQPGATALLVVGVLQWFPILFGGAVALLVMLRWRLQAAVWTLAVIAGSVPLCLVAISKPRYAFPVEPFLIVALSWALVYRGEVWRALRGPVLRHSVTVCLLLAWFWIAWGVFAATSRFG